MELEESDAVYGWVCLSRACLWLVGQPGGRWPVCRMLGVIAVVGHLRRLGYRGNVQRLCSRPGSGRRAGGGRH